MLHSLTLLLASRRYVHSQHCNITPLVTYLCAWTRKMQTSNGSLFLKDSNGWLSDVENGERLHIPVMVKEAIHCLEPQGGQRILDMTFGAGGHARSILRQASNITLFALDRDPLAYRIAQQLSQSSKGKIHALLGRFSQAESLLISSGVKPGTLDGVLLDVGCSSMQFDTAERGFSLRKDGPLDMRMDSNRSTGACVHPENVWGGAVRQENSFSNHSGTQHLPHHQNPAACQHCCSKWGTAEKENL
ncbi:12S rRNA N4-methylcytidine (m4C) methyltransferase isoform X5 [Ambystoma mexicanum]|uniref:12S rRNA N4-methylcytidine (m4C) methyltransferase isoform X5 n=1 Tax=Ambystoma mexicanum TaxID=8296 RepID=UPI0037E87DC9